MTKQNNNKFLTKNKYPTLHVKNFGKIKEAEIELAPFTLFIGDNNSGKSYLLNLIWGLQKEFSNRASFFSIIKHKKIEKEGAYINLVNKLESIIDFPIVKEDKSKEICFDNTDINNIMTLINTVLHKNKNKFIKSLFNSNNVSIGEVKLLIPKDTDIKFTTLTEKHSNIISPDKKEQKDPSLENQYVLWISCSIGGKRKNTRGTILNNNETSLKSIINIIMRHLLSILFPSAIETFLRESNNPVFLPTSRTGFLLSYKDLSKSSLSKNYEIPISDYDNFVDSAGGKLLQSTILFMHMLLNLDSKHDTAKVKDILKYIEKDIIRGKLEMHSETGEFLYTPEGTEIKLEMHTTSAVVTELAPLILYLKYHTLTGLMFMEEPEISLHPELQQKITRVLIKLIKNTNQQIFIATHSDTITQHINNMIKLYNNPEDSQKKLLKEFGYDEYDMISQDEIRMYQFDIDKDSHKTLVKPLASSKYGFRTPTFGRFLDNMSEQIDNLLEEL